MDCQIRRTLYASRTLVRIATAGIASITLVEAANAQSRPVLPELSCAQAADILRRQGDLVMGTGGAGYERFVAHPGFCGRGGSEPAYVVTRDNRQCLIGSRCVAIPGR